MANPYSAIEISDDSDNEQPRGEIVEWMQALYKTLGAIQTKGKIGTFKHYQLFINPGLRIEGHSVVPLPLTEPYAQAIKSLSKPASLSSDEAVVDTSARNVWELDRTKFEITNPAWPTFLQTVASEAAKGLGTGAVSVKLQNLLLYELGAFSTQRKDQDATKNPDAAKNVIGTLVVCLPAEHQGADIHLSFGDQTCSFSTAPWSALDLSAIAWFSDVKCEVKELVSGYRLALSYELVETTTGQNSARMVCGWAGRVAELLRVWPSKYSNLKKLLYPLDESGGVLTSLHDMTGRNRAVCETLNDICGEAGFYLLLATVTHEEVDDCGEITVSSSLEDVSTPDGLSLTVNEFFNAEKEMLGFDLKNRNPDSDDDENLPPWEACEEGESIRRYHDLAALIIPKEHLMTLIKREGYGGGYNKFSGGFYQPREPTTENLVVMIANDLERFPQDPKTRLAALKVMESLSAAGTLNGPAVGRIAKWSLKNDEKSLYNTTLAVLPSQGPAFTDLAKALDEHLAHQYAGMEHIINWNDWLAPIAERNLGTAEQNMKDLREGLSNFKLGLTREALVKSFNGWQEKAVERRLESERSWGESDCSFALGCIREHSHKKEWVLNRQVLTSFGAQPCSFAADELSRAELTFNPMQIASKHGPACRQTTSISALAMSHHIQRHARVIGRKGNASKHYPTWLCQAHNTMFLQCIEETYAIGLPEEASTLLTATSTGLLEMRAMWTDKTFKDLPRTIVTKLITPLVKLIQDGKAAPVPAVGQLLEMLLRGIIESYIPPYPSRPNGWAVQARGCGCTDCLQLSAFLTAPDVQVWHFTAIAARRKHIERVLEMETDLFRLETLRTRTPMTLVVTQIGTEYDRFVRAWERAFWEVESIVRPLRGNVVKELLNDENYRNLVLLESHAQYVPPGSTAGVKREAVAAEWEYKRPRIV
ncbi:hypothetical protein NM208_g8 [Fusarium decemcellulare]|uniref:Uncharacterized protein n=1 Tax=Fusarium decemcellulare TaxID=57161 RepID=A0ACC1T0T0_9HYPO|nr:hypothetical protein NM208_g8 [Fusarium decemcellulare]